VAKIGDELAETARAAIQAAEAEFVAVRGDSVLFRDPKTDTVCSLYIFAVTRVNVLLALKDARERVLDFPPLERTEAPAVK
jgi:hypothetical protein